MHGTRKNKKNKKGGELLDSGGFGCVFYPALKCKNKKTRTNGISKLAIKKNSLNEWNTYKKINILLRRIPNYKKYFLLQDISICEPDYLSTNDKKNFDNCIANIDGYNSSNINNNINKFMLINMPHGGRNLDIVIMNNLISFTDVNLLINNLLVKAIIPMNKLNIYHFDIKSLNILYKNNNLKIIDFGSVDFKNKDSIPKILFNTSGIIFNSPFSNILFNTFILKKINFELKDCIIKKKKINILTIIDIFKKIYNEFIYIFSEGHTNFFVNILLPAIYKIKGEQATDLKNILIDLICNYCAHVILNYFDFNNYVFDTKKYFNNIFSKNVDIYGLLTCYMAYIESPNVNYSNNFKLKIIEIIEEYIFNYKYAITVIPIKIVMSKLNNIRM